MSQSDVDTMRDEYEAYRKGTNVVVLEPDVAKVFRDSAAVNRALRAIAQVARDHARETPDQGAF